MTKIKNNDARLEAAITAAMKAEEVLHRLPNGLPTYKEYLAAVDECFVNDHRKGYLEYCNSLVWHSGIKEGSLTWARIQARLIAARTKVWVPMPNDHDTQHCKTASIIMLDRTSYADESDYGEAVFRVFLAAQKTIEALCPHQVVMASGVPSGAIPEEVFMSVDGIQVWEVGARIEILYDSIKPDNVVLYGDVRSPASYEFYRGVQSLGGFAAFKEMVGSSGVVESFASQRR